jgi:adenylate cyclase
MSSPSRDIAILFADVSGSTKLYDTLGNVEAMENIDRCLGIVKRVCEDFNGRVVKTIGDEVMAIFPTADAAAQAAMQIQMRVSVQRTSRGGPLAMHIGCHFGAAIEGDGDVFGDAVNVAARMTSFAKGGQIFTTAETVAHLAPALRQRTRDHDAHTLKGKDQDIGLYELVWQESEDELTAMSPRLVIAPTRLKLVHGMHELELGEARSAVTLGRDPQNDLVIADRKASRMHARIERRRDKFILVDHSSNGTWVSVDGEQELTLRREELTLRGRGHMSFGHAYSDDPAEVLAFTCVG